MNWLDFIKMIKESESTHKLNYNLPGIKHIHCDPKHKVTVVIFEDDCKEICRCAKGDQYNEYAGICICIAKYVYGKSKLEKNY